MSEAVSRWEASLGFRLDDFQAAAAEAIEAGENVVVSAPTGSGKTAIAAFAVGRALEQGKRAFYTTPVKALSNQKYGELVAEHGAARIGLLTGDTSINPQADAVVMTTEVLRNMIYAGRDGLEDLAWVILDEVHYLQDAYRGSVWEEVIIHAPPPARLVCLSATVANSAAMAEWVEALRGPTAHIVETRRPVPLSSLYLCGDRRTQTEVLAPVLVKGHPNREFLAPRAPRKTRQGRRGRPGGGPPASKRLRAVRRPAGVHLLGEEGMLPAIWFIFGRDACDDAARQVHAGLGALSRPEEAARVVAIAERRCAGLSAESKQALGYDSWLERTAAGVAAHHAGLVPPFKETVEECFAQGLIKVVFATETLSVGINMPARSVVLEKLTKFNGEEHQMLTPGEFAQLTGRAGRRGIDQAGYAVIGYSPFVPFDEVARLVASPPGPVNSSFRTTYNTAANLVRRYTRSEAERIVNLSFAQFTADAEVVRLQAQRERLEESLHNAEAEGPAWRVERITRDLRGINRRLTARRTSLVTRFDQVLSVLATMGYLEGWSLTERGERLAGIYHESDLLVAEALSQGVFDQLGPGQLAALAAALVYQPRRTNVWDPPPPGGKLTSRLHSLERLAQRINRLEDEASVPLTRLPEPGFAAEAQAWEEGADLAAVMDLAARAAGDVVRNLRQCIDLLRQVALVAPSAATREAAVEASKSMFRGVLRDTASPQPPEAR